MAQEGHIASNKPRFELKITYKELYLFLVRTIEQMSFEHQHGERIPKNR